MHISCVETFPEIETRLICFFGFGPGGSFNYFTGRQTLCFEAYKWWQSKQQWAWIKTFSFRRKGLGGRSLSTGPSSTNSDCHPRDWGRCGPWYCGQTLALWARSRPASRLAGGESGFSEEGPTWGLPLPRNHEPSLNTCLSRGSFLKCKAHPVFPYKTHCSIPFFHFLSHRKGWLKKTIFDSILENNSKRTHVGKLETHMCSVYLEKDMLVSFKDCHVFSEIFICYM